MAPVTTVAAVANIAESATISVVAHASSTNSSCMNLAKYMFSTIQAICPMSPKKRRQNQTLPPRGVVLVAVEETECSRVIFPRLSDVGTSYTHRPRVIFSGAFCARNLPMACQPGIIRTGLRAILFGAFAQPKLANMYTIACVPPVQHHPKISCSEVRASRFLAEQGSRCS